MVNSLYRFTVWALLSVCMLACAEDKKPRTELILVADTDIGDLDTIRFEVADGAANKSEEAAPRHDGEPLTLGILLDKGSLGPLTVSALGIRAGRTIVERSAVVSFVPGKTLVVELHLLASCESRRCLLPNQTCSERGCVTNQLSAAQLSEWSGSAPGLAGSLLADAGSTADGAIDAGNASDGGRGDGASVLVTCGSDPRVDLSTSIDHCGDCNTACKTSGGKNQISACVAGECTEECRTLYGDCDGNASNGCEQPLSVSGNCGLCGMSCAAGSLCVFGTCR